MHRQRILPLISLLLAGYGIWTGLHVGPEYSAALVSVTDERALAQMVLEVPSGLPSPSSLRGQTSVVLACDRVLEDPAVAFQIERVRGLAAETCLQTARRMLAMSPLLITPEVVVARAASALGDTRQLNEALVRSQAGSPSTGWLAERRVELSLRHLATLNRATRNALESDVTVLASYPRGSQHLARWYDMDPSVREVLVSVLERGPRDHQRNFLANVRDLGN